MSQLNTYLQHVYIADGFADDCDELIHRCMKVDFLKFETFCEIWKDMQLSCIYHGRSSGAEVAELSEEVLHVAKQYMVANTENFEESVAGLFLVYALLNLQPYSGFASLRIVQEDLPAIDRIATVARRDRRHDVLYILGSILVQGPCQYHAAVRERGMEFPIRKYLEGQAIFDRPGVRPKGVFYRQNEELDIIRELGSLEQRYNAAKATVTGTGALDRNLNYTNGDMAKELGSSLRNLITGIIDEGTRTTEEDEAKNNGTAQSIKQKAMTSKVNPMKHLVGIDTSTTTKPKSPIKKSDIKTVGKVKTGSPTKLPACTTNKRKPSPKQPATPTPKRKKEKPKITFESEDERSQPSQGTCELDLNNFNKAAPAATEEHKENTQESESQVQEIDIQIDSLPCIIRTEQSGQFYEIEIIDELKKPENDDVKNITMLPDVIDEKAETSRASEPVQEMAEISKLKGKTEPKRKRKGKISVQNKVFLKSRINKNSSAMKSKLHRLGMSVMKKKLNG